MPRAPTVRDYHDWLAEGFADPEVWRRHCEQLGAIIRHCQDQGVTIRAVLLPFVRTGGEKFQPTHVHAMVQRFFQAREVAVLDLLPAIAGEDPADLFVNTHDAHPNEKAHGPFAEAIWDAFYASAVP